MVLEINFGSIVVVVVRKDQRRIDERVQMDGEEMVEVDKIKFIGVMVSANFQWA